MVVAMGAQVNTVNTAGVEENCHFLKEMYKEHQIVDTLVGAYPRKMFEESLPTPIADSSVVPSFVPSNISNFSCKFSWAMACRNAQYV